MRFKVHEVHENKVLFNKKRQQSRKYEVGDNVTIKNAQSGKTTKLIEKYLVP